MRQGRRTIFFTSEMLKPDASDVWHDSFGPFGEPTGETELKPEEPRATARIIFVQFEDGSIWGDPAKADDASRDRVLTQNELKLLIETYRTEGKEQFFTELMKPTRLAAIGTLQRLYADTKDTDRVITKAVSMLKIAELHRSAIPHWALVQSQQQLANRLIEFRQAKELPVA